MVSILLYRRQASDWYEKLAMSSVVANLATGMGVTIDVE